MPYPEFVLHGLVGAIDGTVGDGEDLGCLVVAIMPGASPHVSKPEEGEALERGLVRRGIRCGGRGGDQPLVAVVDVAHIGNNLAAVIRLLGEACGQDLVVASPRQSLPDVLLLIPKEVDRGTGNGVARDGIGDEVVGPAVETLVRNDRVADPDDDRAGVSVIHPGCKQVGTGLGEGRGNGHTPVKVTGTRRELLRPIRHLVADVLLAILMDEAVADVPDIELLVLDTTRIRLQVTFDVIKQALRVNGVRPEVNGRTIAEAEFDRCLLAGWMRGDGLELSPVLHDLIDALPFAVVL